MTTQSGPPAAGAGVIHDIGYRHYEGPRLGRAAIIRALGWHSLRSAFGIGRGAKAKIIPVIAFVFMCLPAVVNAISLATHGGQVVKYDTYVFQLRVFIMIIFVAAQAPELVSRDLRSHVLPLYFSRPLRRLDYPAAKLGAFILACLALLEIPLLLLYLGSISQAHGGGAIWDQTRALIPGLLVGLAWAVLLASIGLALASLSGRRALRDRQHRDLLLPQLGPGRAAERGDVRGRRRGRRGRGSPAWSARSPCWTGCASGSAAPRRGRTRRRGTSGRCTA